MALINHRTREIHFKIVYYGPGLGGKTTNLRVLHDRLPPERRGKLISVATDSERTLFFDFLPIDLGVVNGFQTRFHLYTVPGQVYYQLSRRAVLQGVDGIVYVADSHPAREQSNLESLVDLVRHLRAHGLTDPEIKALPRVVQFNKRDLPVAMPVARMHAMLNRDNRPEFEAIANQGRGVSETLRAMCKLVLARLAGQTQQAAVAAGAGAGAAGFEPAARPAVARPAPAPAPALAAVAATATVRPSPAIRADEPAVIAPAAAAALVPVVPGPRPASEAPRPVASPAPQPAVARPLPASPAIAPPAPTAPRPERTGTGLPSWLNPFRSR